MRPTASSASPCGDRVGGERALGQVARRQDGPGGQVARGGEHRARCAGGGAAAACSPAATATAVSTRGQQPAPDEDGAAYGAQRSGEAVTEHPVTVGEIQDRRGPVIHRRSGG